MRRLVFSVPPANRTADAMLTVTMIMPAIVPSPKGPYYFRLIGSKAAVAAQEPEFRKALASLKLQ